MLLLFSPGQYDLTGKFLSGTNPRRSGFPKGGFPKDKSNMGPGPGSYKPLESMGKQVIAAVFVVVIVVVDFVVDFVVVDDDCLLLLSSCLLFYNHC